ncbi:hypothetical protein KY285_036221 [Solanum tuberosum]|nr:hypothetical protein KY285_036221 [Solanum tuberosum]
MSHEVTTNEVTTVDATSNTIPNIQTSTNTNEHTSSTTIPNTPVSPCDAPPALRRTTRSLHTPNYLKEYKYTLPNLAFLHTCT